MENILEKRYEAEILETTWVSPFGLPGSDISLKNPLARATERLIQHGQPFKNLSMCFYDPGNAEIKWLGVLIHSDGDRVLFYPGFSQVHSTVKAYIKDRKEWNQAFHFDHVTLEKDQRSWHITNPDSKEHIGKLPTQDLGESRVFWCAFNIANDQVLRSVNRETRYRYPAPISDSERRVKVFKDSRDGQHFPLISHNTSAPRLPDPSFTSFSFIVGPKGFPLYDGPVIGVPATSPFYEKPIPKNDSQIPLRTYRVELSPEVDIQITCRESAGKLTSAFFFVGGKNQ